MLSFFGQIHLFPSMKKFCFPSFHFPSLSSSIPLSPLHFIWTYNSITWLLALNVLIWLLIIVETICKLTLLPISFTYALRYCMNYHHFHIVWVLNNYNHIDYSNTMFVFGFAFFILILQLTYQMLTMAFFALASPIISLLAG